MTGKSQMDPTWHDHPRASRPHPPKCHMDIQNRMGAPPPPPLNFPLPLTDDNHTDRTTTQGPMVRMEAPTPLPLLFP